MGGFTLGSVGAPHEVLAWMAPASRRGDGEVEVDIPLCGPDCGHMSAFAQDRSRVAESNARQSDRVKLDVGGCF